ncbi:MAG: hypothetical protein KKG59_07745 [Nanoarchaeota archaeon]|nr:hypothetical protein [Nanoarchaeota archaeon]
MDVRKVSTRIAFGIEDFIILFVIILNVLDFFEILPDYMDWIKKIVSWGILGYLLYKVSLTNLFFGVKNRFFDLYLILAYLLLMFKSILHWATVLLHEATTHWMKDFLGFLVYNQLALLYSSFFIGSIMLLCGALYFALKWDFKGPSIMAILHSVGHPHRVLNYIWRYFKVLFVLLAFFVIVFNLLFEWLAIAVDAPLAMIVLLAYIFYFVKHAKRFHPESFLYRIGDTGERFYEHVLGHFKYKETLLLGISGMLVLHLLSDFANFILPYLFSLRDVFYYHALGSHETIYSLISVDVAGKSLIESIFVILVYICNVLGIILLLAIPGILWYFIYTGKLIRIRRWYLLVFYLSIPSLLIASTFNIVSISSKVLVGVDIVPHIINTLIPLGSILAGSLVLALIFWFGARFEIIRKGATILAIILSQVFFAYYTGIYFINVLGYHLTLINSLISTQIFLSMMFMLLLLIQVFFYAGGFLFFQYEIVKHLRNYIRF